MEQQVLIPHLFRKEFRKIVTVITRQFGIAHMEAAEDIASETFVKALETWTYNGIPENPKAWLYTVAKNKAKDSIRRNRLFYEKVAPELNVSSQVDRIEVDLSQQNILDSQLQMLFAICHPAISVESQIGLALRVLCGFGIEEIATALLTSKEVINKRLFRAKEKLREEKVKIELPPESAIAQRLESVLTALYLLFNEGYYSESNDAVLREDLCMEAMRLNYSLIENTKTNQPNVNALYALMCFHASRFKARQNAKNEMVMYCDQDERLWDKELITKGVYHLHLATKGNTLSKFHLEASIAYWHTIKDDTKEKWENILNLFDELLQIEYSPIAALNRIFALSKVKGKHEAIKEAEKIKLESNHFYFTLLGELHIGIDNERARMNFQKAFALAISKTDKSILKKRIDWFYA